MREKLQDLYGRIYDFTDVANDDALEIMDARLAESDLTEVFERWLDGEDMEQAGSTITDAEAEALCATFEDILDELDFEYGDECDEWDEEE